MPGPAQGRGVQPEPRPGPAPLSPHLSGIESGRRGGDNGGSALLTRGRLDPWGLTVSATSRSELRTGRWMAAAREAAGDPWSQAAVEAARSRRRGAGSGVELAEPPR